MTATDQYESDPREWPWGIPMLLVGFAYASTGTRVHAWGMAKSCKQWQSDRLASTCITSLCWVGGPPKAVDEFLAEFREQSEVTCRICAGKLCDYDEGGRRLPDEDRQ